MKIMNDKMILSKVFLIVLIGLTMVSCEKEDIPEESDCTSDQIFNDSRNECDAILSFSSQFDESISGSTRTISANNIPNHKVANFRVPATISEQSEIYNISVSPTITGTLTPLVKSSGSGRHGPQYSFGLLLNGVELDPIAAEPFPHEGIMSANVNWEWNLEALNVKIGLDCNNAHVQPTGKYHYHGSPTLYLESLGISQNQMTHIGYAADGFPIYHKYAYNSANDNSSSIITMTSSYRLKSGNRPGDGITAPCDVYNGVYSNDYEYVDGLGTLDEANGRNGVTPEYPNGIYYYVITDEFPSIPRYFVGSPSQDFKIGN